MGSREGRRGEGGEEQRRGVSSLALPTPGMPPGQRREAGGKATVPCLSGPHSHTAQIKVCSGKLRDPSPHRGRGQGPGRLPPHGKGQDTGPGTARPTGEGSQETPTGTLSSQDLWGRGSGSSPLPSTGTKPPLLGLGPGRGPSVLSLPGQGVWSRPADPRRVGSPSATTRSVLITS